MAKDDAVYILDLADAEIELGIETGVFQDTGDGTVQMSDAGRNLFRGILQVFQNSPQQQQVGQVGSVQPTS